MKKILIIFLSFIILFFLFDFIYPFKPEINYSQIITDKDGKVIYTFLNDDDKWRMVTEPDEIIPELKQAIIQKEDKFFNWHLGVNPISVVGAMVNNIRFGKTTSGASTITMQVVKLLEPKERSYSNKLLEMIHALQLELHFSKNEILQLYLNLVPYGSNIEGVKAASMLYFGRLPNQLSLAQIATLMIIPNRPNSLQPGKKNDFLFSERNRWLNRFKSEHFFADDVIDQAISEPLDAVRREAPKFAPHFAFRMRSQFPEKNIIKTNLVLAKQEKTQLITFNYNRRMKLKNIKNAAVIVINNETKNVEAYIGSPDFYDAESAGQVDGIKAIRSPGSTLKPLVYATAIDLGLITPKTMINDVPFDFGGFNPENFDQKFNGKITIESALAHSLNVPAVKLQNEVGTEIFIDKLKKAGFEQIKNDQNKLGLSLVLGGCGVRLDELANLYSAFADHGKISPLKWLQEEKDTSSVQLISEASAFMITEILTQPTRPDLPYNYQSSYHVPKVAWKTGTSYGRRDAWSVGYNKNYTIGVWVGNFSGEGVPELTGADIATPLLFELFNALDYNSQSQWFAIPSTVKFRYVCAESGLLPDDYCTHQIMDYFIPTVSSNQKCEHLKYVWVAPDEKISYCSQCLPQTGYKKKLYPNLEPEIISFFESQKISYQKIPTHNPKCSRVFTEKAPIITSPVDGKEYLLEKGEHQKLLFSANVDNKVKTVYWYVNDKFFKKASATEKIFFEPIAGNLKISCSDDKGRNSDILIKIGWQ